MSMNMDLLYNNAISISFGNAKTKRYQTLIIRNTNYFYKAILLLFTCQLYFMQSVLSQDIVGCGGFVQSKVPLNFERVEVKLYTKQGALKFKTECAPNNGYFLVAVYDKGDYVLKIDPPNGWIFEPKEIELHIDGKTDPCVKGQDINFKFTGFSVTGLVSSKNRVQGPNGVELFLHPKGTKEEPKKNFTTEGGIFIFKNILPGEYEITASHPTWTFQKHSTFVAVKEDNIYSDKEIIVSGYDVKGHVLSAGDPIQGVTFIIFSKDASPEDLTGCEKVTDDLLNKIGKKIDETPLCCIASGKDGIFSFPSIPSGEYTLVPHYSSQHITFDVVPTKITFKVNYKSVVLKTPFQVHGFSVTGRVVDIEGNGISDVTLAIEKTGKTGKTGKTAISAVDGSYLFENITSGNYVIKAVKNRVFFDSMDAYISPNTHQVPDIKAKRFSVCGKIEISYLPPGASQVSQRKVMLLPVGSQNADMVTKSIDAEGKFCFEAAPGTYNIEALVSPSETKLGLLLKPSEMKIKVENGPVMGITFVQFRATLSGVLKCIGSCENTKVMLAMASSDKSNQEKVQAKITPSQNGAIFKFDNILPGKYKLTPVKEKWCWQPRNLEIEVKDQDIENIDFTHVGYLLKCVISHNITLNFSLGMEAGGSTETVGSFSLNKGSNKFCLKAPGVYHLTPRSCYKFDQAIYMYDTSNPTVLALSAVGYRLEIKIKTHKIVTDLSLTVKSLKAQTEKVIQPTLTTPDIVINQNISNETKQDSGESTKIKPDHYLYEGFYWARLLEEVRVSPKSQEVLFHPGSQIITVHDNCPGGVLQFEGREGIFIRGKVSPPLAEVLVTIKTLPNERIKESKTIVVLTDNNGAFSVGPMHSDIKFKVSAAKDGYIINEAEDQNGNFIALKLGRINIKIVDEADRPMQGVLLSLSGGKFRSNNLTPQSGTWTFTDLTPGQYFLRPMQKEYSFEPTSQVMDVSEGADVDLVIKGKRVAFSVLGQVTTLAGDPEKGISVEAAGQDKCTELQEETATDADGTYRLRGLQPDCTYVVRVKAGQSNPNIERAGPVSQAILVGGGDMNEVNFIIFHKPRIFQLTGHIDTNLDFLTALKVLLYREDNLDAPIHTVSPGLVKFIEFPPLPLERQTYIVRLETTLSRKTHSFESTSASFTVDGNYKKHVDLKFTAKTKNIELEPTQSVIALPLAVALVFLAFHYESVLIVAARLNQFFQKLSNQPQEQGDSSSDESGKLKKKRR